MAESLILELIRQFGAPGAMLAFMCWDKLAQNRLSKERIESDKALAVSMTLLAERIR